MRPAGEIIADTVAEAERLLAGAGRYRAGAG